MYAEPAAAFHSLPNSRWFLCSFFAAQLRDQASHFVTRQIPKGRGITGPNIVLVGLLASFWNVVDPAFLLLVLSLYRTDMSDAGVAQSLADLVAAEFSGNEFDAQTEEQIRDAARASLTYAPDSLRAFVPHGDEYEYQPDESRVTHFRHAAISALV